MTEGPTIAATAIGPGHDGRAEVVVELVYPNGARTRLSLAQEAVARAVDAAGVTSLAELTGHSWTVLVAGAEIIAGTGIATDVALPAGSTV